ncbi:MAG: formate dehydrogenase subunit alpha, partial [Nitrospirae bacterium]|nr:formate dehydrogenase subunit alpha [Nitrospirota bacterium]
RRMGYPMDYKNMEEVFLEIGRLWQNMAGMTYGRLEKGGLQWPCPTIDHPGTKFLFKDKFALADGKGRFTVVKYRPSVELPDEEYPFMLTTGRLLFQYHTGTMTRRVKAIRQVSPEAYVEINPFDATNMCINDGEEVKVTSRRGEITVKARVSDLPDKGVVFIPFHFKEAAANVLTNPVYDPICKIPELKVCAVKLESKCVK